MRGDSLRDFYAKTLAVIGLGVLACAGAVVDYWPVSSALPVVKSVSLPPEVVALTQNLDQRIPVPAAKRTVYVRGTIHARNVGTAKFLIPAPKAVTRAHAPAPSAAIATAVTDWDRIVPTFYALSAPPIEVSGLDDSALVKAPVSEPQAGFIGGALRKTKDSLVRTGAVTGSTIADAFKGVMGAFKKVTPF